MSLAEKYIEAIEALGRTLDAAKDLADYNAFLEKTHAELTHMTPREIRESWRIYREARHTEAKPQEASA